MRGYQFRGHKDSVQFLNGCRGKRGFPSKAIATSNMTQLKRRDYCEGGDRLNVYKCKACGKWHFGRSSRRGDA